MVYRRANRRRYVVRSRRALSLWRSLAALFAISLLLFMGMLMARVGVFDSIAQAAPRLLPRATASLM